MRCTQFFGLSDRGHAFLKAQGTKLVYTDHIRREYPDGRIEELDQERHGPTYTVTTSETRIVGMFDDAPLDDCVMADGRLLEERVQADPWSSGPVIFTALWDVVKDEWVDETLWTDDEIKANT